VCKNAPKKSDLTCAKNAINFFEKNACIAPKKSDLTCAKNAINFFEKNAEKR